MMSPVLVVVHSGGPNRYAAYLQEILDIEGVMGRETLDLARQDLTAECLDKRALVILTHLDLAKSQSDLLRRYVSGGGKLVALRPPLELADLFGVTRVTPIIREGYITINPANPAAARYPVNSLQFHGDGDLYQSVDCQVMAFFAGEFGERTSYPAIFWKKHSAGGMAAAFAYDLALSTVLFHQGLKEQASNGRRPDADGDLAYKPNDLFYRYLDGRLKKIPQADIHQDLLMDLIHQLAPLPLPRIWHFLKAAPAVALIDGDSDGMRAEALDKVIAVVEAAGGKYTLYLMIKDFDQLPPARMRQLMERGHDFGIHFWQGSRLPSLEVVQKNMQKETQVFFERYEYSATAHRGHSVIWVGWTEHAGFLAENGFRLDGNFAAGPGYQEGYINGSALPVKFMDENGRIINLYEQATLSTDDGWAHDKSLLPSKTLGRAMADSLQQIDDLVLKYHGVYHPYFHPGPAYQQLAGWPFCTDFWLETVVRYAHRKNMLFVNGREWVAFNDGRRQVRLEKLSWDNEKGLLSCKIKNPSKTEGITIILPLARDGRVTAPELVKGNVEAKTAVLEQCQQLVLLLDGSIQNEILVHYS
ncbi:MAG: hypothetical protein ABIH24_02135 [Verrucomicrobiota bacterium]